MVECLRPEAVEAALALEIPTWQRVDGKLQKTYQFPDFVAALAFVNGVGEVAEAAQHHPDIHVYYNRVVLELVTHDAGGITDKDVAMAKRLSEYEGH